MDNLRRIKKVERQITLSEVPGGPFMPQAAYAYCAKAASDYHESYPIGTLLLPRRLRPHVAAVYAFSSGALDFVEDPLYDGERELYLDAWEEALFKAYHGEASHPVFIAVQKTADQFNLPVTLFSDLIAAHRIDVRVKRYATFDTLSQYCQKMAHSLARILVYLVGEQEPENLRAADDLGMAMQLTNFCRRLDYDFRRGRLYFPEEDLLRFGVSESDIQQRRLTKQFRALMAFEVSRARTYLLRAQPLCERVQKPIRSWLRMVCLAAEAMLDHLAREDFDVFYNTQMLSPRDWVQAAARFGVWRVREITQW